MGRRRRVDQDQVIGVGVQATQVVEGDIVVALDEAGGQGAIEGVGQHRLGVLGPGRALGHQGVPRRDHVDHHRPQAPRAQADRNQDRFGRQPMAEGIGQPSSGIDGHQQHPSIECGGSASGQGRRQGGLADTPGPDHEHDRRRPQ